MTTLKRLLTLCLAPTLAMVAGCTSGATGGDDVACDGDKCDDLDKPDSEVEDSPCDGTMDDVSGRDHDKVAGRLSDPIAMLAFRTGDTCPTSFADIMAKLRETDTNSCDPADPKAGITTRLISETAQATGTPTDYRAVVTRTCDGRPTHGMIFSLFGLTATDTELPTNVEMIGFDATAGVFNYYEIESRGRIKFFGNSTDMFKGPDGDTRRCAGCHVGGGLVMKEVNTPWLHWEGHKDTPGATDLIAKHQDLGNRSTGAELEGLVKGANRTWNDKRLAFLRANGTPKDVLKPLFCSLEVNVDNGADFESPVGGGPGGSELNRLPADSLLDPNLSGSASISVTFADYDARIKANGQTVEGVPGAIDTVFDYAFPERSEIDNDYVQKLMAAGIIDQELMKDILLVDFTRPLFSDDRCGLLDKVPSIANADLNPTTLRDGLIENLGSPAAGTPEAELLANLNATGGHDAAISTFSAACTALGSAGVLENAVTVTSLNRDLARERKPFQEFSASLPDDNLDVDPATRLNPITCELTTDFVPVSQPATTQ